MSKNVKLLSDQDAPGKRWPDSLNPRASVDDTRALPSILPERSETSRAPDQRACKDHNVIESGWWKTENIVALSLLSDNKVKEDRGLSLKDNNSTLSESHPTSIPPVVDPSASDRRNALEIERSPLSARETKTCKIATGQHQAPKRSKCLFGLAAVFHRMRSKKTSRGKGNKQRGAGRTGRHRLLYYKRRRHT